ncbi:MAG: cupin domain-containing protein [Sandaracinaceae bacterium]|nr:cupin domain-containing protein [Sandaracinaceae bacterium]
MSLNHDHAVDLTAAFATFSEPFAPRRVAHVDDFVVKIVRVLGEFVWHAHEATDELFLVHQGSMEICYRDRTVPLGPGQLHVVPRGVEHRTRATSECLAVIFERATTVNTGDAEESAQTAHEEPFVTGA